MICLWTIFSYVSTRATSLSHGVAFWFEVLTPAPFPFCFTRDHGLEVLPHTTFTISLQALFIRQERLYDYLYDTRYT